MNKFKILVVLMMVCILVGCTGNSEVDRLQKELDDLRGQLSENSNNANHNSDNDNSDDEQITSSVPTTETIKVGDITKFGGFDWQVLDIQDGKALLLSDIILEKREYHNDDTIVVTWEDCDLRYHLNNNFYNSFSSSDKERIVEVTNINSDNPWYDTDGGNDTQDKIFLLSVDEVIKYFGDSGQINNKVEKGGIDDWYNSKRVAKDSNGENYDWMLRTIGMRKTYIGSDRTSSYITDINKNGVIGISGDSVRYNIGIRPAMWIKL